MYVRLCLCFIKKVAYAAAVEKVYLDIHYEFSNFSTKLQNNRLAQVAESNLHILHGQNVAM